MKKQDYSNHRRYYIPHHIGFNLVFLTLIILSISYARNYPDTKYEWLFMSAIVFLVAAVAFMLRQHYALVLQNRIVRLEMRVRYFQLTGNRFEKVESRLSFKQVAALRFASDEELIKLIERALNENLTPGQIKKSIIHWQADNMRV